MLNAVLSEFRTAKGGSKVKQWAPGALWVMLAFVLPAPTHGDIVEDECDCEASHVVAALGSQPRLAPEVARFDHAPLSGSTIRPRPIEIFLEIETLEKATIDPTTLTCYAWRIDESRPDPLFHERFSKEGHLSMRRFPAGSSIQLAVYQDGGGTPLTDTLLIGNWAFHVHCREYGPSP